MPVADSALLVTEGADQDVAFEDVGGVYHQVVIPADYLGQMFGSRPLYVYQIASAVHVNVASTKFVDMFNADATLVVRILSIRHKPNVTTAVTGVVFDWLLERTTSVGTGGTAQTAWLPDLNQTALDAAAASTSKARVAADHARDAAGRLFDDLAAAQRAADDADTSCQSDAEATALRQLFGACSGQYRDMAAEAGSFAGQLSALQVWTGGICAPAVTTEGARGDK